MLKQAKWTSAIYGIIVWCFDWKKNFVKVFVHFSASKTPGMNLDMFLVGNSWEKSCTKPNKK